MQVKAQGHLQPDLRTYMVWQFYQTHNWSQRVSQNPNRKLITSLDFPQNEGISLNHQHFSRTDRKLS